MIHVMLQCVEVLWQCVAVCCNVLQCVAVCMKMGRFQVTLYDTYTYIYVCIYVHAHSYLKIHIYIYIVPTR